MFHIIFIEICKKKKKIEYDNKHLVDQFLTTHYDYKHLADQILTTYYDYKHLADQLLTT